MWMDRFKFFYRENVEQAENPDEEGVGFVYPVTVHPDVCGHPHGLMMLERHIEAINKFEGVEWVTMETICDTFKAKNKPPKGALLPAEPGAMAKDKELKLKVQE